LIAQPRFQSAGFWATRSESGRLCSRLADRASRGFTGWLVVLYVLRREGVVSSVQGDQRRHASAELRDLYSTDIRERLVARLNDADYSELRANMIK